ncbi:MAG TPA: glycosyltransferase, partial [Bacteroidales bacterium]
MILVVFLVGVIYISIIASFFYGWEKLQRFETTISDASDVFTSIIVPVRDEEENIKLLLDDLTSQNYPLEQFEIILVDDHSSDNSVQLAKEYPASNLKIQTLPTDSNGKKAALRLGIQEAKGELIITTDADCRRGSGWLGT